MIAIELVAAGGLEVDTSINAEAVGGGNNHATPFSIGVPGPAVTSELRSFKVSDVSYPDASLHLPTSFVGDSESLFHAFGRSVNRLRGCNTGYGCQPRCCDSQLALDIVLFANEKRSLTIQPELQSLTSCNIGTKLGEGGYLGFRFATSINDIWRFPSEAKILSGSTTR